MRSPSGVQAVSRQFPCCMVRQCLQMTTAGDELAGGGGGGITRAAAAYRAGDREERRWASKPNHHNLFFLGGGLHKAKLGGDWWEGLSAKNNTSQQ